MTLTTKQLTLTLVTCVLFFTQQLPAQTPAPGSANKKGKAAFTWTGAWVPTRKSAGDGITKLDIKIGRFITLPDARSLANVIFNVNNKFPGTTPWATWAVGDLSKATPAYENLSEADHEKYLSYMDQLGVTIFLEIFPFKANAKKGREATDVTAAVNYWLKKFRKHPCVAGMGIELEYFGKATDSLAAEWDATVKSHNPSYRLFFRHYNKDYMPPTYRGRGDLLFINDASEGTLEELNNGFAAWANHFAPTAVAFQLGYPADEDGMNGSNELGWWKLASPIKDWGNQLLPLINNTSQELGFIWVTAQSGKTYHTKWDLTKGASLKKIRPRKQ